MSGLSSSLVVAPDDGSLGPLLRVADDRLAPGAGYGAHDHRAVDVVAVVLAGELRHAWGSRARLRAGDVAVLRAGTGLTHDEIAGDGGARLLQSYLRSADPAAAARHEVVEAAEGWLDLGRADARLWVGRAGPGRRLEAPAGFRVVAPDAGEATAGEQPAGPVDDVGAATVLVWALDRARPAWAR